MTYEFYQHPPIRSRVCLAAIFALLVATGGPTLAQNIPIRSGPVDVPTDVARLNSDDNTVQRFLRVPQGRTKYKIDGGGLAVAVLSTGVNPRHEALVERTLPGRNFSGQGDPADAGDGDVHGLGTHLAGLIVGRPTDLLTEGIAPGARVVPLKITQGQDVDPITTFARINEALNWVLEEGAMGETPVSVVLLPHYLPGLRTRPDPRDSDDVRTLRKLVARLRERRVPVVVPAGNGYVPTAPEQGMSCPAIFPETISVGAVYGRDIPPLGKGNPLFAYPSSKAEVYFSRADRPAVFSARLGERVGGEGRTDIFAPGFLLNSAGPGQAVADQDGGPSNDPETGVTVKSGTEQASALAAGAILLLQQLYRTSYPAEEVGPVESLPEVDLIERCLREGGEPTPDVEDEIGREIDTVDSTGETYLRLDVLGALDVMAATIEARNPSAPPLVNNVSDLVALEDTRNRAELTGTGLAVVVIDSGVNPDHLAFRGGKLLPGLGFTDEGTSDDTTDTYGNGSLIAGLIAGRNPRDMTREERSDHPPPAGIAYGARIVPLKVYSDGLDAPTPARVNQALRWVLEHREAYERENNVKIGVVFLSLGAFNLKSPEELENLRLDDEARAQLVDQRRLIRELRGEGVAVVAAAGNAYGTWNPEQGMAYPAVCPETISVGAVYDRDYDFRDSPKMYGEAVAYYGRRGRCMPFSQRLSTPVGGPSRTDIFAPGVGTTLAGPVDPFDPEKTRSGVTAAGDGTNIAASYVAGAVLLLQEDYLRRRGGPAEASLPPVELIEACLREGGERFVDEEEKKGEPGDSVTCTGETFRRLDLSGALDRLRSETR